MRLLIRALRIENFRSIDRETVHFAPLTAFVGANASGKSNLLDALSFLQDVTVNDVETAIEERGGINEVRCKRVRQRKTKRPITLEAVIEPDTLDEQEITQIAPTSVRIHKWVYRLEIGYRPVAEETAILLEKLDCCWSSETYTNSQQQSTSILIRTPKSAVWTRLPGPYRTDLKSEELDLSDIDQNQPLLSRPRFANPSVELVRFIRGFAFFSIDPEVARLPSRIGPRASLGERGEGLASVLKNMLRGSQQSAVASSLSELMRSSVPDFESIRVTRSAGGKCVFEVKERGLRTYIGPDGLSDGTIKLLCYFLLSLYTGNRETVVTIEEPETGLHPHLTPMLAEHLLNISESKQVIITTHDPRLVSELSPENVIMVDRSNSLTRLRRASDKQDIDVFLKRFRLGDIWLQGELGGDIS